MPKSPPKEVEAAKAKKAVADQEAQKRLQEKTDYERLLEKVLEVKTMTDTPAWQSFYRGTQRRIEAHGLAVLNAEKNREVIQHQEGVKILRTLIEEVAAPVRDLQEFINRTPLFAKDAHTLAEFNVALGKVELRAV